MDKLNNRKEQKCAPFLFYSQAICLAWMHSWWNSVSQITVSTLGNMQGYLFLYYVCSPMVIELTQRWLVCVSLAHACWRWSIACLFRNREHSSYTDMYLFRASLSNSEWKIHSAGSKSCAVITIIRVSNLHIKIPLGNTQVHSLWLEGRF